MPLVDLILIQTPWLVCPGNHGMLQSTGYWKNIKKLYLAYMLYYYRKEIMSYLILLIGVLMMALTVGIHAVGSVMWLDFMKTWNDKWTNISGTRSLYRAVIWTAVVLLLLHFIEVVFWALFYFLLPDNAGLNNWPEAVYFSVVTFTTLGYGDITLNPDWRQLSGMQAMVGIVVFGLTTAILFTVIQRLWQVSHTASNDS